MISSAPISLSDVVAAYTSPPTPWTKARAVRQVIADRMAHGNARGKGYNAGKRATVLAEACAREIKALAQRIAQKRRQRGYDILAECGCDPRSAYLRNNFKE